MPRKSSDAIASEHWRARLAPPPLPYPKPPKYLNERATEIWWEIVRSKPGDYFDAPNRHLLSGFCLAAATADIVNDEMAKIDYKDPKQRRRWNTLQIMSSRQSKLMVMLATRLRLLPTKYMAEKALQAHDNTDAILPWEGHIS